MKIAVGSDHGGIHLKNHIREYLTAKGIEVLDCGTLYGRIYTIIPIMRLKSVRLLIQAKRTGYFGLWYWYWYFYCC